MDNDGREVQVILAMIERGFEFAKALTLVPELFTVENGLLTPTFKIKRPQAKAYLAEAIANMCAEVSASDPTPRRMS
ncbi:hypothetical protein SLEP1_g10851 [Rubroshorea leprosula]|uniref:Uncharacterized protein n=1 Tax=Rubroshorea leprosula TaxID=152421 RepID=A0AAV5IHX5_9ROSI|nr:hypothetical protein SLEP1_g10851 [Rubroshorea leprosula]